MYMYIHIYMYILLLLFLLFFVVCLQASTYESYRLYVSYPSQGERAINLAALLSSVVLLVVSITDWCEHGAMPHLRES